MLEKCLYFSWLSLKKDENSTVFRDVENVFETSVRNFLHDRRSNREIERRVLIYSKITVFMIFMIYLKMLLKSLVKTYYSQPQKGKWQSFTAAFGKMMKPAYDDLFVNFNAQAPTLVKFQFYRALQNIIIADPNWSVLSSALKIMLEKPAHSITQERGLTISNQLGACLGNVTYNVR